MLFKGGTNAAWLCEPPQVEEDKEVRTEPLLGLTSPTRRTTQGSRHKCDKIGGGAGYDDSPLTPCTRPRPVAGTQALCP